MMDNQQDFHPDTERVSSAVSPTARWWSNPLIMGLILPLMIFLINSGIFRHYTIDDVSISYRYALHLAEGHGLTWNPGQPPVEGYSNFLWVIYLAGGKCLGLDIELLARFSGLVLGSFTLVLLFFLCRRLRPILGERYWWFPVILVALNPAWVAWQLSGLEIALFGLLLVTTIYGLTITRYRSTLLTLGLTGLCLTRPEGFVLAPLPLLFGFFSGPGTSWSRRLKTYGIPALIVLIAWGALVLFRLSYFGYFFPNSVAAKFMLNLPSKEQVGSFLVFGIPFFIGWLWFFSRERPRHHPALGAALALVLWQMVVVLPVNPVMNFLHRYLISFLPLLVLCSPVLLRAAFAAGRPIGLVALVLLLGWSVQEYPQVQKNNQHQKYWSQTHQCVIEHLLTLPVPPLISLQDAGRIPYQTDLPAIDSWGLCNRRLAREGSATDAVLFGESGAPEIYIMTLIQRGEDYYPATGMDIPLSKHSFFKQNYRLWKICPTGNMPPQPPGEKTLYRYGLFVNQDWERDNNLTLTYLEF